MARTTVTPTSLRYRTSPWTAHTHSPAINHVDCAAALDQAMAEIRAAGLDVTVTAATSSDSWCWIAFVIANPHDHRVAGRVIPAALTRAFDGIVFDVGHEARDCM